MVSTLLIYSSLSRITQPLPLSGEVIMMEGSERKAFKDSKRCLGKVGNDALYLEKSLKELCAIDETS